MKMDDRSILEQAKKAISEAGETALEYWQKGIVLTHKTNDPGTVTEADKAVEEFLKGWIRTNFPDDSIVAEESGGSPTGTFWSIDPIDGTNFFAHRLVDWSISLARFVNGEAVMGLTLCPPTGELFWATKGGGAFVNGKRIRVSAVRELKHVLANLNQDTIRFYDRVDVDQALIKGTRSHWVTGSTALTLARLAEGKIDLAVHMKQSIWDIATASVLIPEAGGVFRRWDNGPLDCTGDRANDIYADNGSLSQDWFFLEN
jgi:fructose-1,6-bisphosphatase/inositol monophosphatase family enzyme